MGSGASNHFSNADIPDPEVSIVPEDGGTADGTLQQPQSKFSGGVVHGKAHDRSVQIQPELDQTG